MTTIVRAETDDEIADVRHLLRAFMSWRRELHGSDNGSLRTDNEQLDEELRQSRGDLLIAYEGDQPVGCASVRNSGNGVCEVERIFVAAVFRGQRFGRALVDRLLLEARANGYQRMRLDISVGEDEAMRLCERAGFHRLASDQAASRNSADQHVYFEQVLRSTG